jgi:heme/copper-type cytochrome/quinol oxidase subunit 2
MASILDAILRRFKRRWLFWELLALTVFVGSVGAHIALPFLDSFFLNLEPDEVFLRMYVKESGGFDPAVITLSRGKPVRLIIMSMDVVHSLVIPELGIDSGPIAPGYKKVIAFTPTKAGEFEFYCLTICSPMHPFMRGTIKVI